MRVISGAWAVEKLRVIRPRLKKWKGIPWIIHLWREEGIMFARCLLGNNSEVAWSVHFFVIHRVSHYILELGHSGQSRTKTVYELEKSCPAFWFNLSKLKGPRRLKEMFAHLLVKVCLAFSSVEKYHQQWKEMQYRKICFFMQNRKTEHCSTISMWTTILRLSTTICAS